MLYSIGTTLILSYGDVGLQKIIGPRGGVLKGGVHFSKLDISTVREPKKRQLYTTTAAVNL